MRSLSKAFIICTTILFLVATNLAKARPRQAIHSRDAASIQSSDESTNLSDDTTTVANVEYIAEQILIHSLSEKNHDDQDTTEMQDQPNAEKSQPDGSKLSSRFSMAGKMLKGMGKKMVNRVQRLVHTTARKIVRIANIHARMIAKILMALRDQKSDKSPDNELDKLDFQEDGLKKLFDEARAKRDDMAKNLVEGTTKMDSTMDTTLGVQNRNMDAGGIAVDGSSGSRWFMWSGLLIGAFAIIALCGSVVMWTGRDNNGDVAQDSTDTSSTNEAV